MVLSCLCFASMSGIIRHLSTVADPAISPFEIVFFRNWVSLALILPWVFRHGRFPVRTTRLKLHALRAVIGLCAMAGWFYAISIMALAPAVALNFTVPLFALIVAIILLGERPGLHRWGATLVGFAGVIVILQPGTVEIGLGPILALSSALGFALSMNFIKMLARTDSPSTIVFYQTLIMTPLSLGPALAVWQTPGWSEFGWLVVLGALATAAHLSMARSLALAEASAVASLDFVRLPFVAVVGYVVFAEIPDAMTWVGGAIIIASSVYISRREALKVRNTNRAMRKNVPPDPPD
jgi:drug/metabolite transporter (DMT)-like permease